jgi:uncharacterized protein YndB with AHSA1/START domain
LIEPVRLSFDVACPVEHAFTVWTAKASRWWPAGSTISHEEGVDVVFEGRVGGRVFERTGDGRELEWGLVTAWEPPRRLAYQWWIATDRESATDVEISFVDTGPDSTRVDIEHRGWERLAERGPSWRDVNLGGWDSVMPVYLAACLDPALRDQPPINSGR